MISEEMLKEQIKQEDLEFFRKVNKMLQDAELVATPLEVIKFGLMLAGMECHKQIRETPRLEESPLSPVGFTVHTLYHLLVDYHAEMKFKFDEDDND